MSFFIFLSAMILLGFFCGFCTVILKYVIAVFHNFFLKGDFSFEYNALQHTFPMSDYNAFAPMVGAFIVCWIITKFSINIKMMPTQEAALLIQNAEYKLNIKKSLLKSFITTITIGSGGPTGTEGAVILLGAIAAYIVNKIYQFDSFKKRILFLAGTASGLASTFNTPLAGLLFVVEILFPIKNIFSCFGSLVKILFQNRISFSIINRKYLLYIPLTLISVFIAVFIRKLYFQGKPFFRLIDHYNFDYNNLENWRNCILISIISGITSAIFIISLSLGREIFRKYSRNIFVIHITGMFLVSLIIFYFISLYGNFYLEGAGYSTINDVLENKKWTFGLVITLLIGKLLATSIAISSGALGGSISPSLFVGALLGYSIWFLIDILMPSFQGNHVNFSIMAMACIFGCNAGKSITPAIFVSELTNDYGLILPLLISSNIAIIVKNAITEKKM